MEVVARRPEGRLRDAMTVAHKIPLVSFPRRARIDLIVEVGINDVNLLRADPHYRPIYLVQLSYFPDVLPPAYDIVIELITVGQLCQKRSRYPRD